MVQNLTGVPAPGLLLERWHLENVPSTHNSPVVSPHTLGLKSSRDHGSQGAPRVWRAATSPLPLPSTPTWLLSRRGGQWSLASAKYTPPLSLLSTWGAPLQASTRLSPSPSSSHSIITSLLCLPLAALCLQLHQAFSSPPSRHLLLTLYYLFDDLVYRLSFPARM